MLVNNYFRGTLEITRKLGLGALPERENSLTAIIQVSKLPNRQREVLQLLAEGQTTKEVAALLKLSGKTVEYHRAKLMKRIGVFDLAGLTRLAIRAGLVNA